MRTTRSIVHFTAPFLLGGIAEMQEPCDYAVDQDEEPIEGISWLAYRRVATFIHLPAIGSSSGTSRMIEVDPLQLDASLKRDSELTQ